MTDKQKALVIEAEEMTGITRDVGETNYDYVGRCIERLKVSKSVDRGFNALLESVIKRTLD